MQWVSRVVKLGPRTTNCYRATTRSGIWPTSSSIFQEIKKAINRTHKNGKTGNTYSTFSYRALMHALATLFGILMTERNPWIFSALVCYVLLCFGGGFATMPSFILDVFGSKKMSNIYGAILTAWACSGNLRTPLRGISERRIPRPRSHILFFDRDFYARPRVCLLLFAKRRPHSPSSPHIGKHPAPVWHFAPIIAIIQI